LNQAQGKLVEKGIDAIIQEGAEGYKWLLPRLMNSEFGLQTNINTEMPAIIQLRMPLPLAGPPNEQLEAEISDAELAET